MSINASRLFASNLTKGLGGVRVPQLYVNVKDPRFGAVGNNVVDDTAAIQGAINYAKIAGSGGSLGGVVFFPSGIYNITSPLILPRTGSTPNNVVQLEGENGRSAVIKGSDTLFPINRALIEWEATTARIYHNRISNLNLRLPNVSGTKAIWHKRNNPTGTATSEWMQCNLENLLIECSNEYHEVLMDFEVGLRVSSLCNIVGDPSAGTNPIYDTLLLRVADGGNDDDEYNDAFGVEWTHMENLVPMLRRGGFARAFSGRIFQSTWNNSFCNGARHSSNNPIIRLVNSINCFFSNITFEGYGESAQFHLIGCEKIRFFNCGLGTPDATHANWLANTVYAIGNTVVSPTIRTTPTPPATSKKFFTCTVAGTSGATAPVWPESGTVTDGSVTWEVTGDALGDMVVMESSRDIYWYGRLAVPGGAICSNRLVKAIRLSADCDNIHFEDFDLRTTNAGDASPEFAISATRSSVRGHTLTGSVAATVRTAYSIGSTPYENNGTATISSGSTSVVVTHGLAATPALSDIRVTPTNNLGSATKFWVSSPTATQFTINVDIDPGATTATFSWSVNIK